ncbi:methyltransferase [Paenibacillus sp. 598K]|uniref:class I SAM-dependent methyltransferase n=1 Tax=Paenibacillus sp. 598K TaxID=1117987 RepID=UPI000FFA6D02|nr:class I SAM-dependent methyltransferase [Paenibacillus sp. 598K]GBF72200.1 methyltransferase [Paenibacillus sp. 598K]
MIRQEQVSTYWEGEATLYSEGIAEELKSPRRQAWLELIEAHAPEGQSLRVLDVGCGPGFFSVILAAAGHQVTGADCAANMLEEASAHASSEGVTVDFKQMDTHTLDLPDESYDLVVCRNVTWSLPEPERAYREWMRVLRPGGRLLIFDANWNWPLWHEETQRQHQQALAEYRARGWGEPPHHADREETDRLGLLLPLTRQHRPAWDEQVLSELGFVQIASELDLGERVLDERRQLLSRCTPMFLIRAER